MKKVSTKLVVMAMLILGVLSSCSKDPVIEPIDPTDDSGCTDCQGGTDLSGSLEEDRTLDASQTYNLTGVYSVESGATLTIPAGTEIIANPDLDESDATNVYIVVQKGGKIDIQGSSSAPVIMRSSNGQAGSWGGLIIAGNGVTTEGVDATAEVGGILYGGTDNGDNSGSINYLVLSDAGAQINAESQFNGLSLYAVGSGTKITNVALNNGADDGVEFFGGAASATNLYLENNEDDAVDWTEGWSGSIDNVYILHTIANFSTALEGDGENKNPKINNLTAVSTTGGTALQFKKNSGMTITGLSLSGYDTAVDITDDTRTDLSGIILNGETADLSKSYSSEPTVQASAFDWISNRGAVSVLPGTIDNDLSLDANTEYVISGVVSVNEGATLTIPAGTKITARSDAETAATSIYIVVQKGAMIDIQGTEAKPVVMSSTSGTAGSWGGLVIAGNAVTTEGVDATAEVGGILYGGTNPEDNSGSIKYLILKDAGAQINAESQYNGLSLYAVGSGTTIENIAMLNGADDGVEFFGGSVTVTNAYFEDNEDDQIDWTEGWDGGVTNAYINLTINNFSTALEGDGENNLPEFTNLTAVSSTGGTALQFKKNSGAVITGLSLSGFDTNIDITDDTRTDLSGIQIEGVAATLEAAYDADATVDVSIFDWVN
ncbi:MAG: hypothetical protein ABGW91_10445 [Christiangramia sp.]|uniref:Uncharacterized protein n=1 Tax=Christiangramia flava JLT2011 TaxID=1229726 RepID=A0A1L7I4T8_9FLAO|nr:hypothetical protein [Christiangramia flava]APU68611.1 hypothetical protein GRFL_1887 [Christiangramia flava JLT2011]MAM18069.1 hypothetical protein [Christiangramia sp.]OSS40602.1 hypothetical protein C723_0011 [Christiangramia flava JLT2011]